MFALGQLPDGGLAYAMQLVRGRTLGAVIDAVHGAVTHGDWQPTQDGWTFRKLLDIYLRIVETLAYAHHLGIMHRDLKPDNVMIGEFGEVQVLDWGLAMLVGHAEEVAGTRGYMAPEQFVPGPIGRATDVWGLGAILHQILYGSQPFPRDRQADTPIPEVRAVAPVPVELERIRRRCLSLEPSARSRYHATGFRLRRGL